MKAQTAVCPMSEFIAHGRGRLDRRGPGDEPEYLNEDRSATPTFLSSLFPICRSAPTSRSLSSPYAHRQRRRRLPIYKVSRIPASSACSGWQTSSSRAGGREPIGRARKVVSAAPDQMSVRRASQCLAAFPPGALALDPSCARCSRVATLRFTPFLLLNAHAGSESDAVMAPTGRGRTAAHGRPQYICGPGAGVRSVVVRPSGRRACRRRSTPGANPGASEPREASSLVVVRGCVLAGYSWVQEPDRASMKATTAKEAREARIDGCMLPRLVAIRTEPRWLPAWSSPGRDRGRREAWQSAIQTLTCWL